MGGHSTNYCIQVSQLDRLLESRDRAYLGGDTPGVIDIAMASLMAPVINPREYYAGKYIKWFDRMFEDDIKYRIEVEFWRSTVTGKYCLDLYKEFRGVCNIQSRINSESRL